jgi:hypothetical protein
MERNKSLFKRTTLAVAVSAAMVGMAQAEPDAWNFSGLNARGSALQSDYTNLKDSYNIWVNPSLLWHYSNRVDVNATDDGVPQGEPGDVGETGAGAYKTFGDHAFGAFLGRPSDSVLADVNGSDLNTLSFYSATAAGIGTATGAAAPATLAVDTPSNQFDLLWAWNAPAPVYVGARLNFQAISDENDYPTLTAQTPNTVPTPFTGSKITDQITKNNADTSTRELNLALGVADKGGLWDAALLYGRPSGKSTAALSDNETVQGFVADAQTTRTINAFDGKQKVNEDGARNLGLAVRALDVIPNTIITLLYQRQNNSYKSTIDASLRSQFDATSDGTWETDTTAYFTEKGKYTNENGGWSLWFTRNFVPAPNNMLLATIGLVRFDGKEKTVNTVSDYRQVNNVTSATIYNLDAGGPFLGKQTNTSITAEWFALPLTLGFEGAMTATMTARAAISKDLYNSLVTEMKTETWEFPFTGNNNDPNATTQIHTTTLKTKSTHVWDTPTTLSLGAGYKDGNLGIDAVVEKEFVTQGVDNGLVSRVNVTYLLP